MTVKIDFTKELRPVEALYLIAESEKKKVNEIDAIFSILIYLVNNKYIHIMGDNLEISHKAKTDDMKLRIYEKNILNSISIKEKIKIYYTIKNFDFKEFLCKKKFFKKETKKRGLWRLLFNKTKYTPTDKYHEALDYLNSLKMEIKETQKFSKTHIPLDNIYDKTASIDKMPPELQHLKSYAFAFSEFILNFKEISIILGISDIALICKSYTNSSYQSVMSATKCDACKACKGGNKLH